MDLILIVLPKLIQASKVGVHAPQK